MNNKITPLPNGDFRVEELAEVGKWMDEDKCYSESTHEKQQEWAKRRNYEYKEGFYDVGNMSLDEIKRRGRE